MNSMVNVLNSFIGFYFAHLFWFEFLSLFISGVMLWLIIYFNLKLGLQRENWEHRFDVWNFKRIAERKSLKAWRQIKRRLKSTDSSQAKLAVMECDKILDELFKNAGFPGKNLDERLKNVNSAEIPNIEELRQAHKIRNRLALEPDFEITPAEAEIAAGIYKKTFVDLDLLSEDD